MKFSHEFISAIIELALKEDLNTQGDITSNATIPNDSVSKASIITKESGILCGQQIVNSVFKKIDPNLQIHWQKNDGDYLGKKEIIAQLHGNTRSILKGERTALNFLQRLTGISTAAHKLSKKIERYGVTLLDTRKTLPGHRLLDKYAVKTGGGKNHRIGLYDMILIKENHIKAAGSITEAVNKTIELYGQRYEIEVETENMREVEEAINLPIQQIMLDNFQITSLREAVNYIRSQNDKIKIEVSGNVTEDTIEEIAKTGIDYISVGAITHSVKAFDFSLLIR